MSRTVENENVPSTAEPPPIAMLLPLLQWVLGGSSLLLRLGARLFFAMVYPLSIIWSIIRALLFPVTILPQIAFEIALVTPYSIIRTVAVALYPVYAFCAIACIFGAMVGFLGHFVSTAIVGVIARSKYFAQLPSPSVVPPSSPQAMLRKRRRKHVRLQ